MDCGAGITFLSFLKYGEIENQPKLYINTISPMTKRLEWSSIWSVRNYDLHSSELKYRSSLHKRCNLKMTKNLANFTGKHLRWSLFLINFIEKRFQHRCLPVKFSKFLRTPILKNVCKRLLLLCISFTHKCLTL